MVAGPDLIPVGGRRLLDAAADKAVRGQRRAEDPAGGVPFGFGVEGDVAHAGEHRGIEGPIEVLVGMDQRDENRLLRGDHAAQHRLAEVEVHEEQGGVLLLVLLDEAQHRGGVVGLREEEASFGLRAHPPYGMERGDRAQQMELVQVAADPEGRAALSPELAVPLPVDRVGAEAADRHAVLDAFPFGKIRLGVAEDARGGRQHLDVVEGGEPFGEHAAVCFGTAVHRDAVADDDKGYLFLLHGAVSDSRIKIRKNRGFRAGFPGQIHKGHSRGNALCI